MAEYTSVEQPVEREPTDEEFDRMDAWHEAEGLTVINVRDYERYLALEADKRRLEAAISDMNVDSIMELADKYRNGFSVRRDYLEVVIKALAAKAAQRDEWLERIRDLATIHWTLSEANADDVPKMVADTIIQLQHEWDDPAVSEVAAKAALADRLAPFMSACD